MADRLPFMPLETGEYLASTAHLTAEQHGNYLLLRIHYWNNGGLPNDDVQLAAIARVTAKRWMAVRPTLAAFFGPNWIGHDYLDRQRARCLRTQVQRRTAGEKGGVVAGMNRANVTRQVLSLVDARTARRAVAAQPTQANATADATANAIANAIANATADAQATLYQPQPQLKEETLSRPEQVAARARDGTKLPHETNKHDLETMFERKRKGTSEEEPSAKPDDKGK